MIVVRLEAPFATFRKSFARGYGETYPLAPPATVYGMLLSMVGERFRSAHEGVKLAFAYRRLPRVATSLRKLSRLKYGVAGKQSELGNQPDYIETLCGLDFVCWIDSSSESTAGSTLEDRVAHAITNPESVTRYGVLSLGLSDDAVDSVSLCNQIDGDWLRLRPYNSGSMELPVWVDHVGGIKTRWQRYELDTDPVGISQGPANDWAWTVISAK